MKRLFQTLAAGAVLAFVAAVVSADEPKMTRVPPAAEVASVAIDKLAPGMRVKLQLTYASRKLAGTVTAVTDKTITLDLSTEEGGLPGKLRLKKDDVMLAWELARQTKEEKDLIAERQRATIAKIKVDVAERADRMKADSKAGEAREKTSEANLRKAMDVVVGKEQEAKMRALLAEFPPDKWSEDTARELRERWILMKIAPNDQQNRFLMVFNEWKDARDTVAILDARDKDKAGEKLLMKFPPSEGWGKTRLDAIGGKEAAGAKITDDEAEFKKIWPDWLAAAEKRIKDVMATPPAPEPPAVAKPAGDAPAPTPIPDPAATPTPSKPGTGAAVIVPRAPAHEKPATDKPADAPAN